MSIEVVTAAISFVAAVVAVVIGQLLGQRFERQADERRWIREDAARRRVHGEEVARQVRRSLLDAAALFEAAWVLARPRSARWEYPPDDQLEKLTDLALDLEVEVPDDDVRLFTRHAAWLLLNTEDANQGGAPEPWIIARAVAAETDAVIGAYLRGERLPPATEVEAAVSAAAGWQAEIDAYHAEKQAEWQKRRAEKAAARKAEASETAAPTQPV